MRYRSAGLAVATMLAVGVSPTTPARATGDETICPIFQVLAPGPGIVPGIWISSEGDVWWLAVDWDDPLAESLNVKIYDCPPYDQ